jgi:hypothetical protein
LQMKQIALYIILFSYSIVMLKPISPYVSDAVEHFFNYTQHMATVHYENGKYHVHKDLVNQAKKDNPAKENSTTKKENSQNDYIVIQQKQCLQGLLLNISYPSSSASDLINNYLAGDYPPPRA